MRTFLKLIDAILFLFFIVTAIFAPLIDSQTVLPRHLFPDALVDLRQWFIHEYDNYLFVEKPSFYVGVVWLLIVFMLPLCLLNLYALLTFKSWYPATCLTFGVSFSTSMVAVVFELIGSGKASDKLMMQYLSLLGMGILATLRGLASRPGKIVSVVGNNPAIARKKTA